METTENIQQLLIVVGVSFILCLIAVGFYVLFVTYKKRIESEQKALREVELNFERQINEASFKAEEKERIQIAMDLHDEIGALMTVLKINLSSAKTRLDESDELFNVLNDTSETLEKTIDEIRNISNRIFPPTLTRWGLEITIKELIATVNNTGKITINYKSNLTSKRFNGDVELNIYRIVKELINNILKHGFTTEVHFLMEVDNSILEINLKYLGIGLNESQVTNLLRKKEGNGLKSIQSRVNNLKGFISYNFSSGHLAEIRLEIPILEIF